LNRRLTQTSQVKGKHLSGLHQYICDLCDLQSWPNDALQAVATRFLGEVEMTQQVREGCIEMCKQFHTTTMELSERYHSELERHNYVTPTSYLELISTFKMLLDKKRRSA